MRSETMLTVRDVEASSCWYQQLLGCRSGHGGPDFEMLMDGDELLLMLHRAHAHEHAATRSDPVAAVLRDAVGTLGAGVCVYIRVDDVDAIYERAQAMDAEVLGPPRDNPLAHHRELELRDPDGYFITVCK
jgi:catechol 2,3-dioxygenase-like lactoylglutathione lyase family enzyme